MKNNYRPGFYLTHITRQLFLPIQMGPIYIYIHIYTQGVFILRAQKLTTYKIIIGEHCGVNYSFCKILIFIKIRAF